jgi:hypothetical protein
LTMVMRPLSIVAMSNWSESTDQYRPGVIDRHDANTTHHRFRRGERGGPQERPQHSTARRMTRRRANAGGVVGHCVVVRLVIAPLRVDKRSRLDHRVR